MNHYNMRLVHEGHGIYIEQIQKKKKNILRGQDIQIYILERYHESI